MPMPRILAAAALFAAWIGTCCAPASAMTLQLQGDTVFATGPVEDDLRAFVQALDAPGVRRVVFVRSPGGDLWTGLQVGRLIAERGVDTVAAGHCMSACSLMFLGGRERRFADAFAPALTQIGLHGANRTDTRRVDPQLQPQIYAWFKLRMGDRFNATLMNLALYEMDDFGALLRVFDEGRPPRRVTTHCRSAQTLRKDCREFPQDGALSLGVTTHADLVTVDLPASMRDQAVFLGQPLGPEIGDAAAWLVDVAARACRNDACRQRLLDWPQRRDHWAVALAVGGASGWGRIQARDTLQFAALGALYACNHRPDAGTALCELGAVDGLSAQGLTAGAQAAHDAALAALQPPAERFHANEEFGGALAAADAGLRTQRLADITPARLPGIETIATQDLARTLRAASRPVLIDVSHGAVSIPGAQVLWHGGQALEDAAAEAALDARFRALLALMAPDKAAPVVFFGMSRGFWQAANAARRAARAGWQQVRWYRGGMEAWQAAGLPVVPPIVRAVVW